MKYWGATVALGIVIILATAYYGRASQPHPGSAMPLLFVEGGALFVAAGIAIVMRAYYHRQRFDSGAPSASADEATAMGILGREYTKPITLHLSVDSAAYKSLRENGELSVAPARFDRPVRRGDSVRVCTGSGTLERCLSAVVSDIDGVNQRIRLERQP